MPTILQQAMVLLVGENPSPKQKSQHRPLSKLTERQLIKLESQIGRTLFGEIPKGHDREFFCLDADTWVWHEAWKDTNGKQIQQTVRYEVRPDGILKVENEGRHSTLVKGQELANLTLAVRMYQEKVIRDIYKHDPKTGNILGSQSQSTH